MKEEDLDRVVEIEKEVFPSPWSKGSFSSELKNPFSTALVWEEERVEGYIIWRKILGEVHILNLAVSPSKRRRGIGSALLRKCLDEDAEYFVLEVRKSNTPAIELYKKFGFRVVAEIRDYYSFPKEDALVMFRRKK